MESKSNNQLTAPSNWLDISHLKTIELKRPKAPETVCFRPLSPLNTPSFFSDHVLDQIGLQNSDKKENQSKSFNFFNSLFTCGDCGCKALSRETLNQIYNHPNIQKQLEEHLKDKGKREQYKKIWEEGLSRRGQKQKRRMGFEEAYRKLGHANEQEWKKQVDAL